MLIDQGLAEPILAVFFNYPLESMDLPISIVRTVEWYFHFYSNVITLQANSEDLIRNHDMRRLSGSALFVYVQ